MGAASYTISGSHGSPVRNSYPTSVQVVRNLNVPVADQVCFHEQSNGSTSFIRIFIVVVCTSENHDETIKVASENKTPCSFVSSSPTLTFSESGVCGMYYELVSAVKGSCGSGFFTW